MDRDFLCNQLIFPPPKAGKPLLALAGVAPCLAPGQMLAIAADEISDQLQPEGGALMTMWRERSGGASTADSSAPSFEPRWWGSRSHQLGEGHLPKAYEPTHFFLIQECTDYRSLSQM